MIEESEKLKSTAEDKASRMADRLVPYTLGVTALGSKVSYFSTATTLLSKYKNVYVGFAFSK